MRFTDGDLLCKDRPSYAKKCAVWVALNGLRAAGKAFEYVAQILLSQARSVESLRDTGEWKERVLLPVPGERMDQKQQKIKVRCPGCFTKVMATIEIHGVERCEDCKAIAEDSDTQWQNSGLN